MAHEVTKDVVKKLPENHSYYVHTLGEAEVWVMKLPWRKSWCLTRKLETGLYVDAYFRNEEAAYDFVEEVSPTYLARALELEKGVKQCQSS